MTKYFDLIEKAKTLDELDSIIESASLDEILTNEEYCNIYSEALKKAQSF